MNGQRVGEEHQAALEEPSPAIDRLQREPEPSPGLNRPRPGIPELPEDLRGIAEPLSLIPERPHRLPRHRSLRIHTMCEANENVGIDQIRHQLWSP